MELAESVSVAMMVVLETLGPDERAVFVLREVFGFDYDEIAAAVGKSPAAVRQIAHRSRAHVQARRPRFAPADPQLSMEVTERFLAAAATGDIESLMATMAPQVVWTSDSDGKASAARRPIVGADKVARLLLGFVRLAGPEGRYESALYNNAPAVILYLGDHLEGIITLEVVNGQITNFYAMRNPEKLAGLQ